MIFRRKCDTHRRFTAGKPGFSQNLPSHSHKSLKKQKIHTVKLLPPSFEGVWHSVLFQFHSIRLKKKKSGPCEIQHANTGSIMARFHSARVWLDYAGIWRWPLLQWEASGRCWPASLGCCPAFGVIFIFGSFPGWRCERWSKSKRFFFGHSPLWRDRAERRASTHIKAFWSVSIPFGHNTAKPARDIQRKSFGSKE